MNRLRSFGGTTSAALGSFRRLAVLAGVLAAFLASVAVRGNAQEDDARFATWTKFEGAAETRTFKETMRAGGALDAKARGFLEEIALPQLALEANRPQIAIVRKRLREFLLNDITEEKAAEEANRTYATSLERIVAKEDEAAVVRVNAMMLVGELQGTDRKPWPGAVPVLVKAATNADLPKGVRIAAVAGLTRHVDAVKGNAEALGRIAPVAGPALVSILKEMSAAEGGVENDWLVSRCLATLVLLGPAGPEAAAEISKTLDDSRRSFDVRVRAATALAAVAGPQSKVDGKAAIATIEKIAVASLERETAAAERRKLEKVFGADGGLGGPGMPGAMPGGFPTGSPPGFASPSDMGVPGGFAGPGPVPGQPPEQLIPREACRRAAWRLYSLANAVLTADGQRGLGSLAGDDLAAVKKLAETMRGAALTLDANPVDASLLQAVADLKPEPPAPKAEPADAQPAQ